MSVTHDTINSSTDSTDGTMAAPLRNIVLAVLGLLLVMALVFLGIHQRQMSDPYVRSVLSLEGDSVRGEEIFRLNCATCHGLEASGEVGPDLHSVSARKSRIGLIDQVISGKTPPMPQFQPEPKEMADLLEFLETL
ncbi:MAG: cytochrome c [Cyanobacteria bacterium J06632_22]